MTAQNKEKFFFFKDNCSNVEIHPNSIEHAYLAVLCDDLKSANMIFKSLDSPRSKWGALITDMLINGCLNVFPSYFQIRNFYEIDLDFLIKNKKIDYVEQILGALDIFSNINQEIYKYTGRVMYVNHLYSAAEKYMEQSKNIFYNDPELHYMYAKYFMEAKNYKEAYFYINECLKLLPSYYPAKVLINKIEEIGF